jgi:succinate dehydrogenase hydrophobic anchor subunit
MANMSADMSWYYSKNGTQLGPISSEELKGKAGSGEIFATDLVWKEGMADWRPFGQVSELQVGGIVAQVPYRGSMGSVPIPQPAAYPSGYNPQIPNYLWQSIVATVLGALTCWMVAMPLGIVAIVYAAKVEGLLRGGDIVGATSASKSAKNWMIGSFSCLALCILFVIAFVGVAIASGEFK